MKEPKCKVCNDKVIIRGRLCRVCRGYRGSPRSPDPVVEVVDITPEMSEDQHAEYHLLVGLRGCGVEGCDPDLLGNPWAALAAHFQALDK